MTGKIKNFKSEKDCMDFLQAVRNCREDVYLVTTDGDRLNMKSILSQYVFSAIAGKEVFIKNAVLSCSLAEDFELLQPFMINSSV